MTNRTTWSIDYNPDKIDLRGKVSGQIKTTCPFCGPTRGNKKDASMSVNIDSGAYHCHHCEKSGNLSKQSRKEVVYTKPVWNNKTELSDNLVKWFEKRGISQATLKRARITEQMEWMPVAEKEMNVVCFNYFRGDELINVKYRDGEKHFKMFKDAERIWYNHDAIYNEELVIVEGEIDALSFMEVGINNVVSVPNGAKNYDFFDIETLDQIKKIYIAVDNDSAGLELQNDLIRRIGPERCVIVDFEDCKDANEYLVKHSRFNLSDRLKKAVDVPVTGVICVNDYLRELQDMFENGLKPGVKLDHSTLSEYLSFETGRLMVVTGIPGHGKSEFVDEVMTGLMIKHSWKIGYYSPENFPVQLHISKLMAKITGKWIQANTITEFQAVTEYLNQNTYWVMPEDEEPTLTTIFSKAEYLVKKHGIKAFVIDPWNMVEFQLDGLTETQYISKALSQIGMFARRFNVLVILVAHPVKIQKGSDGLYEVPNLYSINGSSHFYNKSDFGLTVYRDQKTDEVQIYIQKVKFRHLGHTGMVRFRNNPANGRYQECLKGYELDWDNSNRLYTVYLEPVKPTETYESQEAPF